MPHRYIPDRGDLVWIDFTPQAGHEQAGRRPALVLSPQAYNQKVGMALFCPITSQIKGYTFEVVLPNGLKVTGAVLADQIRSLDWHARKVKYIGAAPSETLDDVLAKLAAILAQG